MPGGLLVGLEPFVDVVSWLETLLLRFGKVYFYVISLLGRHCPNL